MTFHSDLAQIGLAMGGAVTYLVNDDLQLDIGGNFGLDQATPDLQLYVGLSTRF